MLIRRVLCAVDFSDPSLRALHHAAALASGHGASLDVLHVVPRQIPAALPVMMVAMPRVTADDAIEPARQALRDFLVRARLPLAPRAVVRHGSAVDVILAYAAEIGADVVVLGSHGREGIGHLLFGSTAERVLHRAACPALVVPLHAGEPGEADCIRYTQLLCAVDFSPASLRALALAIAVAHEHAAPLTVLHVIEAMSEEELENLPPIGVREHVEALTRRARERLHAAVPSEAHAAVRITEVVRYGRASHAILLEGDGRDADLLVLGAQGYHGLGLLGLGSVTDTVVRRARCPVLTTR